MFGYNAWRIHKAVALHLTSLKYDLFETRGHVRGNSVDHYARVKMKHPFEFAERQCRDPQELVQYFVANIAYSRDDGCYDLSRSWDAYRTWVKNKEMMTQLVLERLDTFDEASIYPRGTDGDIPGLLYEVVSGKIVPEVAVAINRARPYIDAWLVRDYAGLNRYPILIKKLDRFVKYNAERVDLFLAEKADETV